jgi:ribosomal protein S18 acetylase RimI-like enzyme
MIRTAQQKDKASLERLYDKSVYGKLPQLVEWALKVVPERVFVAEEHGEILSSAYSMVCGYDNLWSSYLAFREEESARRLIDYLLKIRSKKGLRNLYVFCPKDFVDIRAHLISRRFVPECIRNIDGKDYIVELHDGAFNPACHLSKPLKPLSDKLREGKSDDVQALAGILHESLPRDFNTIEDAVKCARRWLDEMREYTIVAEHKGKPVGVLLISSEIHPVLDRKMAMLCYIAVDKQFRGRGIGKALLEEAYRVLRKKGKRSMEVDVSVHNIQARIFYTKAGFYPFWLSKNYMPHDNGIFYRIDF